MINLKQKFFDSRIFRFLITGTLNSFFGFLVFSCCQLLGLAVNFAIFVGMLSGVIFNFFTTGGIVFRQLSIRRFPLFIVCYLAIYAINVFLFTKLSVFIHSSILNQAILTVPLALLSYLLMSNIVFRKTHSLGV